MTVSEAATLLGVSRRTIMRMIADRRLIRVDTPRPYLKKPRNIRLDSESVKRLAQG